MNILDENIITSQRLLLKSWRVRFKQIGLEISHPGVLDEQIIALLHRLRHPTFFTRDTGFYDRRLCHSGYCLIFLSVDKNEVAYFVRRLLRHPELNTRAKRMGAVIRASRQGLFIWRLHTPREAFLYWL